MSLYAAFFVALIGGFTLGFYARGESDKELARRYKHVLWEYGSPDLVRLWEDAIARYERAQERR